MSLLITTHELSTETKLSVSLLNKKRLDGTGPEYVKLGRAVRYSRDAVSRWLAEQTRTSTSQR
jgi:predicted DNA-binding transcriptional regulator AlpA